MDNSFTDNSQSRPAFIRAAGGFLPMLTGGVPGGFRKMMVQSGSQFDPLQSVKSKLLPRMLPGFKRRQPFTGQFSESY